jgi:multicomponent Na+:H+ antiporter subunit D
MSKHIPAFIITIPLLLAFLLPVIGRSAPRLRNLLALVALGMVNILIFSLIPEVFIHGKTIFYAFGAADPLMAVPEGLDFPVRILLKIDSFAMILAIVVGIVSLSSFLFSIDFIEEDSRKNYYTIIFFLLVAGLFGMSFTNDLFNFFVFLELASISGGALVSFVTFKKSPPYAGFKYLLVSTLASTLFLVGVALCYAQYGSFNMNYINSVLNHSLLDKLALIFILAALAFKAGAVPMHMWIPDTYSEAPAPITIMLKTTGLICLGVLFKVSFSLFGNPVPGIVNGINHLTLGWIIIILGVLSMFVGVTMALVQHDVKRLMAYHSVSQTGYILLGVGVGVAVYTKADGGAAFKAFGSMAMAGGIFHFINNAFYKSLLFLTSGVMEKRFGTRDLNSMIGMAHRDTFTTVIFMIGALAISGIPPFNGFASKLLIYESVYKFHPLLAIIAMFVSVMTLASFMKVFYSAFLGPRREDLIVDKRKLPMGMGLGMLILAVLVVLLGLFPDLVINNLVGPAISGLVNIR